MNMTPPQIMTLVINIMAGFGLLGFLALQFDLWNRWQGEVHSTLVECEDCESTKALKSSAQKFAVYLAIRRAEFWDAIIDKLGKTFAPWPFIITIVTAIAKLQSLSSQKQGVYSLLVESQPVLYWAFVGEIITVGLLLHIHRHVTAYQKMFPRVSK